MEINNQLSISERKKKKQVEALLKQHGYTQDTRPDHREWTKITSSFLIKIRLDQNNPKGWNGFQVLITTYLRWKIPPKHLELLLPFLKREFEQ